MFYEVRILDSEGNVKKILSSKKLSSSYWKGFYEKIKGRSPSRSGTSSPKRMGQPLIKSRKPAPDKFYDEYSLTDN